MIGLAGFEGGIEVVGWSLIIPVHRIVILEQPDFWNGEEPERLVAIAVINVVGAIGGRISENAGELSPQITAAFIVIIGLGGFLPGVNVDVHEGGRRRLE